MADIYLGIDLGTSSVKVGAYTAKGEQIALASRGYAMLVEEPGMFELEPEAVCAAAIAALTECAQAVNLRGRAVKAISFSTQLHSLLAVDEELRPLTNVMTWADVRGEALSSEIQDALDIYGIFHRTAARVEHPVFWPLKLFWLRGRRPELFRRDVRFISIKAYLMYKLTGELAMDWSDASSTGLFDIAAFEWDAKTVEAIPGLSMENLVETRDCAGIARGVRAEMARAIGLPEDALVIYGAGDGMTAHIGCGAARPGILSSTVGTSGAIRAMSRAPVLDPERRTFCLCLQRDLYVAGGAINNGGVVLSWLREQFQDQWAADQHRRGSADFYELVNELAGEIAPGSEGVVFLPLLSGERAPHYHSAARGVLSGLTLHHDRRHIVRAALEGVMYQLNGVYRALEVVTGPAEAIHANGGYTNLPLWMRIQAEVFDAKVVVPAVEQASALGAAMLGMLAAGDIGSLEERLPVMNAIRVIEPEEANAAAYRAHAARYAEQYAKNYPMK